MNLDTMRLYGRQRLRGISQKTLELFENHYPSLRVNLDNLPSCLSLEIGCGYGEHLIFQATQNPEQHFIGCEPFLNGIVAIAKHILDQKINNISLYQGDAKDILEKLSPHSLKNVFLLFPDPWPKTRHQKRRFVQKETLAFIHTLLKEKGQWHIASDHPLYQEWVDYIFSAQSYFRLAPSQERFIKTRYEQWALHEGRAIKDYVWEKI